MRGSRRKAMAGWPNALRAAVVGALGAPLFMGFLVTVWATVDRANPGMTSIPVLILLAMPVGLLAGCISRGIDGFAAFWLGAFGSTVALATALSGPGFAGLASALAVLVIPQALLPGYVVARLIDGAASARRPTDSRRLVRGWIIPSAASLAVVGLIAWSNGAAVRGSRQTSCAAPRPGIATVGRIAFVGSHALCVADLASSSVTMAYGSPTEVDETLSSVRWSPDGSTLAVIRQRRPLQGPIIREIALVPLDGSPPTAIPTPSDVGIVQSLDWAPDGGRLVVASDDRGCAACGRLRIVTLVNATWTTIPTPSDVVEIRHPAWSPTGDRILIDAATDPNEALYGRADLRVIDLDGRVIATIASDADHLAPAAWSRDGSWIAFGRRVPPGTDVFVARADGTESRRLTTSIVSAGNYPSTTNPVWSPDGSTLAVSVYLSNELPHAIRILPSSGEPATLLLEGASDYDWLP
jgi:WD40-like Beta Propeller Repeat